LKEKKSQMIYDSLNLRLSRFRRGLNEREPQAVFFALMVVVLLVFVSTLSWLYVQNGPSELDAGSFGMSSSRGPQPLSDPGAQENETEQKSLTTSNFNAQAQRMTIATDEFETTTHLPFPKQSKILGANLTITPTTMQSSREYFDENYIFHNLGDLDRDGVGDRVSVLHSGDTYVYPELEIGDGKNRQTIVIPLEQIVSKLVTLDVTQGVKLNSGHSIGFSTRISHLSEETKNITTHLGPERFSSLAVLLADFTSDGYPDLIFILEDLYAIIYLENTGRERFFERTSFSEGGGTLELLRVFDIEAIFTYRFFEKDDNKVDFTPQFRDIDNDGNPELFVWFSVKDSIGYSSSSTSSSYLISFDTRFFNGDAYQSTSANVIISSGMIFFKGITGTHGDQDLAGNGGDILGFPVFFSTYDLIKPQLLFLPEQIQLENRLGSELYDEFLFRENASSPLYTQGDVVVGEGEEETGRRRLVLKRFEENESCYLNFDIMIFYPNSISRAFDEENDYTPLINTGFILHYEYSKDRTGISYDNHFSLLEMDYHRKTMEIGEERYYPPYYGREIPYPFLDFEWENGTANVLVRKSIIKGQTAVYDEGLDLLMKKTEVPTIMDDDIGETVLAYAHWDSTSSGDINGDGVSDLVAMKHLNDENFVIYIFVYKPEEHGSGRFVLAQKLYLSEDEIKNDFKADMKTYSSSGIVVLADLTGSGTTELIYANGNNIIIFPNTRESTRYFDQGRTRTVPGEDSSLSEERIQEYVYLYSITHGDAYKEPFFFPDNTSSSFRLLKGYLYENSGHSARDRVILLNDIDLDGDIDLCGFATISDWGTTSSQLYKYINHGTGELSEQDAYFEKEYHGAAIGYVEKRMSFDFYGDGVEELAILHRLNGWYYFDVYSRSSTSGVFLAARLYDFLASTLYDFFLCDFDNDGLTDVVFRDSTHHSFSFYKHREWWTFEYVTTNIPIFNSAQVEDTLDPSYPDTLSERYLSFHDFNDDGENELFLIQRDTNPKGYNLSLFHETAYGAVMKNTLRIVESSYDTLYVSFVDMNAGGFDEIVLSFRERIIICVIDSESWAISLDDEKDDMDMRKLSLTDSIPGIQVRVHNEPLFADVNRDNFPDILLLLRIDTEVYLQIILYSPHIGPLPYPFNIDLRVGSPVALKLMDFDFDGVDELILFTTDSFSFIVQNDAYEANDTLLDELSGNFQGYGNGTIDLLTFAQFLIQLSEENAPPLVALSSYHHNLSLSKNDPPHLATFLNLSSEKVSSLRKKIQAFSHGQGEYYSENLLSFVDFMVLDRDSLWSLTSQINGYPQSLKVYMAEAKEAGITEPIYSIDGVFFKEHKIDIGYELASYLGSSSALNGNVEVPLTFILGDRQAVYGSSRSIFDVTVEVEYELPELELHELKVKGRLVEGGAVDVVAYIRNAGRVSAEYFRVTFFVDGKEVGKKRIDALFPGQEKKVEFEWKPALFSDAGEHTISVTVDTDDEIIESQRFNNMATTSVTVTKNKVYQAGFYMLLALAVLGVSFYLYRDSLDWRMKRRYEESGNMVRASGEMLSFMKKEDFRIHPLHGDYRNARSYLKDNRFDDSSAMANNISRKAFQMVEGAMPAFSVAYPEVVFSELEQWCSVPLHIANTGEAAAAQVRTRVLGNVKIMDNIMPFKLHKGDEKEVVFGIYPHRFGAFEFRVKLRFSKLLDKEKKPYLCEIRFRLRCEPTRRG